MATASFSPSADSALHRPDSARRRILQFLKWPKILLAGLVVFCENPVSLPILFFSDIKQTQLQLGVGEPRLFAYQAAEFGSRSLVIFLALETNRAQQPGAGFCRICREEFFRILHRTRKLTLPDIDLRKVEPRDRVVRPKLKSRKHFLFSVSQIAGCVQNPPQIVAVVEFSGISKCQILKIAKSRRQSIRIATFKIQGRPLAQSVIVLRIGPKQRIDQFLRLLVMPLRHLDKQLSLEVDQFFLRIRALQADVVVPQRFTVVGFLREEVADPQGAPGNSLGLSTRRFKVAAISAGFFTLT